ncbi:MAG: hypothetical protein C0604_10355 [Clostridiales bacterium]|nr:MAG: hypothetical protein C0604_10355 [Clostridiales bacterium]
MIDDAYYYASEFARQCGISRDTLEYYNRIGLLAPCKREENGYGLYSPEQEYTLQLITYLKIGGCTLNEIKEYLYVSGMPELYDVMEGRKEALERKRDIIDKAIRTYDYHRNFRLTTLDLATRKMRIVRNPRPFYIFETEMDESLSNSKNYRSKKFREHLLRCNERSSEIINFPIGIIYSLEALLSLNLDGICGYCNYCIGKPENTSKYTRIPSTDFMTYMHTDSKRLADKKVVSELLEFAQAEGYKPNGPLFTIPFTRIIDNEQKSMFDSRIFISVEKA